MTLTPQVGPLKKIPSRVRGGGGGGRGRGGWGGRGRGENHDELT